jgi:hypothetical protein
MRISAKASAVETRLRFVRRIKQKLTVVAKTCSFYDRALFIALRPLCFTVIFSYFLFMVAREQARAATIMFLRCFFVFLFFMVAREQARAATIMFLRCFFVFLFFIFFIFIFFIFFVCRQLIMSKASAYGDEIWQVDSLPQNADRMFISLKSLKGFARGRGEGPQNSIGGSVSITGE